jgi:hypothetical protein
VGWEFCLTANNPLSTNSLHVEMRSSLENGKEFEVRSPIGNFRDIWEIFFCMCMMDSIGTDCKDSE